MSRPLLGAVTAWLAAILFSVAEPSMEAEVSSKAKFVRLREGSRIYLDREVVYHSVPEKFAGYKVSVRNFRSEKPVRFKVRKAGTVRLVASSTRLAELLSDGWSEAGRITTLDAEGRVSQGTICVIEKRLDIGDYSISSKNAGCLGVRLLKK